MSTTERAETRQQTTTLAPLEPVKLPVVEPNPRGHQAGDRCREPGCGDCHWDVQRLKYWLRGRLLAAGADDAEVDKPLGAQTPGLLWRRGDRLCAIEVRSAPVSIEDARIRTARLKAVGCDEVLWLCPTGYWIGQIPALGVDDFAAAGCEYRALSGGLVIDSDGILSPRQTPWGIREFIDGWVAGELACGYLDEDTRGWATVSDWEAHTHAQAMMIAQQRQELLDQRTELALARRAARDKAKQMHKMMHRLERAELVAGELDAVKRRLSDRDRLEAGLRVRIARQREAVLHWQLLTCFAMLVIVTFIVAGFMLK
ncbi:hypothetical protein [Nocardia africana]|uniref:Uncharacterized protein n=1 Tax=Nocardia africana TaxID=134964 RepID=A0A378WYN8_9NOCA|nr:hypothetical protein [Nocardia africana]MCC3312237.1 hypothetical protein [Nocardia africana]SUA46460.1 Uncharacterised protein [Nocardia africana]